MSVTIKNTEYRYKVVNNFLLVYKVLEELKEVRIMAFLYAKGRPGDGVYR